MTCGGLIHTLLLVLVPTTLQIAVIRSLSSSRTFEKDVSTFRLAMIVWMTFPLLLHELLGSECACLILHTLTAASDDRNSADLAAAPQKEAVTLLQICAIGSSVAFCANSFFIAVPEQVVAETSVLAALFLLLAAVTPFLPRQLTVTRQDAELIRVASDACAVESSG